MHNSIERLLLMSDPEVLGLNGQAALGVERQPERSQFLHLLRHFLERFFNHETASPDGDAKARMVLIACATGLPPFIVAIYLWPLYHAFIPIPRPHHQTAWLPGLPPYWVQVNHHFFFVVYSFAALGIATVFEWDLFFPDLLDLLVLSTLPIPARKLFLARVAAIAVLIAGFLFDANVLAVAALPAAIDPPNLLRFLAGDVLAVVGSGLFAAAFILASQGVLLFVFGERWFRRMSLLLQGAILAALLLTMFLFPVYSGATAVVLRSGGYAALCFPPFWFLGIYQRMMEGPAAFPIYSQLACLGCEITLGTIALAILVYPLAYRRRVLQLVEGANSRSGPKWLLRPLHQFLHATMIRPPVRSAVFHFIGQTLLRVPRYRIYLVLYGSVGVSVLAATVVRFAVLHGQVHIEVTAAGIRAAIGIVPLWTIAGLRVTFASSGNRQGNWIFRIVHGRPPQIRTAMEMFGAARMWALVWSAIVTFAAVIVLRALAPLELLTGPATAIQLLMTAGLCVALTDAFFLNLTTVAFTGEPQREPPNLAFTVFKYFIFFPPVVTFAAVAPVWIGNSAMRFAIVAGAFIAAHLAFQAAHRRIVRDYCRYGGSEEGEGERALDLGLRHRVHTSGAHREARSA
ncbi:MAG TPA: hypothetical protein VGR47_05645 [Terracidiphilus sp.]|nr:hypothetical protein [Terracidiphilus sp.]